MNALSVKGLTKRYPNFLLQDISFDLPQGKIMGLIGINGAGKSTTLKSIINLVNSDSGRIEMLDKDFRENEESCKQDMGVVLGGIDFYNHKKLTDITAVTKRFYKNWDDEAYQRYIKAFSLSPHKKVKELSSGMKVKYMLALALSHKAKLLILDEPTSGLDPVSRDDILELFRQLVDSKGLSILFSTHITSDLEKCADYITYIKDGRLLKSAEKSAFIESFQHLKEPGDKSELSLEEIMIRTERRSYDV
ncbi:ABC transporter ATP-binding protein [Acetivibrio mesophilus]|uniref:ABC transporter ATP-binding protein n=1 Tax=Acetivibrio mesophilus TaxID=2487273 RepID=A0A4V1K2K9_9FIRM|nr:ABC transporter ATP-binding protein [Acetivibrio mesophilus]ODM26297.1 ABC transporter ATP-binding protein [Clostridium sp. Bc-iso-3]RXE60649.1 ABC transporter ATP-binding protein [Acetivibrio mesophilus]HHV28057.1 ABC transporter ATP-binding protein [Clostridium sp.]